MVFPGNRLLQESRRSSSPACVILTAGDDLQSDRSPGSLCQAGVGPAKWLKKSCNRRLSEGCNGSNATFPRKSPQETWFLPPLRCLAPIAGYGSIGRPILGGAGEG